MSTIDVRQRIGDTLNRIARRQALDFMEAQEGEALFEREAEELA